MFVVANFLNAVAYVLDFVLTVYMYILIARAILSWVNPDPYNPIVNFLYRATEPVLHRVRRVLPDMGGLDLSPLVVLLAIFFLQKFVINSMFELVNRLKFGLGA
ncbi:YggT family protein [Geobacter sp. DSM 9736]|uniref:YggT family protein n=1 Tax=Geobacter sp. DSM 9736 TaxID=1277350 RepID=UPI000B4FEFB1|nr:YggT family protein [Geobacter sp. DSM 9736]